MENLAEQSTAIHEMTDLLKILSEPTRVRILEKIMDGVQCNCELGSALKLAPNLISHHLSVLRDAELIETQRDPLDARWIYYSVNMTKLIEIRSIMNDFFNPQRVMPRSQTCGPVFAHDQSKKCG